METAHKETVKMKSLFLTLSLMLSSVASASSPAVSVVRDAIVVQSLNGPLQMYRYSPADLGVDGAALNATVTSNSFSTEGWRVVTLACDHTNDSATEIQVRFQRSCDWVNTPSTLSVDDSNATWAPIQAGDLTEGTGEFNDELHPYEPYRTVSADDNLDVTLSVNYPRLRFVLTSTSGTASDTIQCYVILGI